MPRLAPPYFPRRCGAWLLLAAALHAPHAGAQGISDDVVRIGVLTDLSGQYADTSGKGTVEAVKMAVEDFGGSVLGKPVEVVWADHQSKADVGANHARTWFDRGGVDTIVDLNNTAVSIAVYTLARERGKLLLNTAAASDALTGPYCMPTAIHYTFDTYAFASGTVRGLLGQGKKDWYILTVDYAFGKTGGDTIAGMLQAGGGSVAGRAAHPLAAHDFSSFILQAQESKAQVVTLVNAGVDTVNAIKTASQFGLMQKQTLVPQIIFISDVRALGLKLAQGMVFATAFYWDRTPETRAWAQRFAKRGQDSVNSLPTMSRASAYSAVTQYLKAVQATGTDDGAAVAQHMKSMTLNDMFVQGGHIRADGRMVHDMYLVQVKSPQESRGEPDYYKILATIPGDQAFRPLAQSECPLVKKN